MRSETYKSFRDEIKSMDVLAFSGKGIFSKGIQLFTGGQYSHGGVALWVHGSHRATPT